MYIPDLDKPSALNKPERARWIDLQDARCERKLSRHEAAELKRLDSRMRA